MGCTAEDILTLAKSQIGITELPYGSNTVKYNTAYYGKKVAGSSYPWCCVFVWWLFDQSGAGDLFYGGGKTASCTALMQYAKNNGLWVRGGYKPGDIILYNFDSDSSAEHVGVCESTTAGYITCIEGNTSVTSADNGGSVMRRTRSLSVVLGAYRPKYAMKAATAKGGAEVTLPILRKGSRGASVKALQTLLNGWGFKCGSVDGDFGKNTLAAVKSFQSSKKISVDGVVGKITWTNLLT